MYFVRSGRMKVLRKVDFKIPRTIENANDFDYLTANPGLEDYKQFKVESKLLEVDELTNGEVFGEFACILKEKIQYTALTAVPTEVIVIERTNFIPLGKEKVEFFL
jgi:CRP-like cAMP-binding protein